MSRAGRPLRETIRVGVISDTHGLLRPEAKAFLQGASRIVHAGDIGHPGILEELRAVAPLDVIRGNNDDWAVGIPDTLALEIGGVSVVVVHDRADLGASAAGARIVIVGHSHKPLLEVRGETLFLNPGSAGPRRFKLPIAAAEIRIGAEGAWVRIVDLTTLLPIRELGHS